MARSGGETKSCSLFRGIQDGSELLISCTRTSVDERFQLERAMGTLPKDFGKAKSFDELSPGFILLYSATLDTVHDDINIDEEGKSLRRYMMQLDANALKRLVTVRSKEANSLIEKQTQALFGRPDIRGQFD
ncbi:hypothetical protein Fmac_002870 [Flemingia macrophylla]|uniref:Uncharacterized protein n=1 Tax=Flemingia macrophylla TaxID=520843 RepID=A0ABD1NL54_9FABA